MQLFTSSVLAQTSSSLCLSPLLVSSSLYSSPLPFILTCPFIRPCPCTPIRHAYSASDVPVTPWCHVSSFNLPATSRSKSSFQWQRERVTAGVSALVWAFSLSCLCIFLVLFFHPLYSSSLLLPLLMSCTRLSRCLPTQGIQYWPTCTAVEATTRIPFSCRYFHHSFQQAQALNLVGGLSYQPSLCLVHLNGLNINPTRSTEPAILAPDRQKPQKP